MSRDPYDPMQDAIGVLRDIRDSLDAIHGALVPAAGVTLAPIEAQAHDHDPESCGSCREEFVLRFGPPAPDPLREALDVERLALAMHVEHIDCEVRTVDDKGRSYGREARVGERCFTGHDVAAVDLARRYAAVTAPAQPAEEQHEADTAEPTQPDPTHDRRSAADDGGDDRRPDRGRTRPAPEPVAAPDPWPEGKHRHDDDCGHLPRVPWSKA